MKRYNAFMHWNSRMHDLIDFDLCLCLEMYIRGNGRDLTTNFDNDPDFSFITENLSMTKENDTVSATFLQSCEFQNKSIPFWLLFINYWIGLSMSFLSIRLAAFYQF